MKTLITCIVSVICLSSFSQNVVIDLSSPVKAFNSYMEVCKNGTDSDLKKVYLSKEMHQQVFPGESYFFKPIETLRLFYKSYETTTRKPDVTTLNRGNYPVKEVKCADENFDKGISVRFVKVDDQWYAYDSENWREE